MKYLIDGPIGQEVIVSLVEKMNQKRQSGGHSIFLGQVRADKIDGRRVRAIEYSAYEAMVEIEADKIRKEILSEFSDADTLDIVHSTGMVAAGKISLLVFVSAGHRQQAIEACSKAVDLIKERLPVWKKEVFEDNSYKWK